MKKILLPILLAASFSANAAITNGGFETGDLTGWTCGGADYCISSTADSHTGTYSMQGYDNTGFATLSQSFATAIGSTYDLEFWSRAYSTNAGNILRYDISGSTSSVSTTTDWLLTQSSFVASSALTSLSFLFETNSGTGTWFIDDVSVGLSDVSQVPVPAALFMFAPALLGFMGLRRKAKNSVA